MTSTDIEALAKTRPVYQERIRLQREVVEALQKQKDAEFERYMAVQKHYLDIRSRFQSEQEKLERMEYWATRR